MNNTSFYDFKRASIASQPVFSLQRFLHVCTTFWHNDHELSGASFDHSTLLSYSLGVVDQPFFCLTLLFLQIHFRVNIGLHYFPCFTLKHFLAEILFSVSKSCASFLNSKLSLLFGLIFLEGKRFFEIKVWFLGSNPVMLNITAKNRGKRRGMKGARMLQECCFKKDSAFKLF